MKRNPGVSPPHNGLPALSLTNARAAASASHIAGPTSGLKAGSDVAVPIINYHDSDFVELPWLRRLFGARQVRLVRDTAQALVIPNSIVICTRLGELKPELLGQIEQTPGVMLYHISDEWYREPLEHYRRFAHVIRNYYHTGLCGSHISQFPLGPCQTRKQSAPVCPASERRYAWSFAGNLASTRRSLVASLERVTPNRIHLTAGVRGAAPPLIREQYVALLCDSAFVPCAMGNVNLESFRLYEALDCGAIPIVEKRPWLDYFTLLFGSHPLPSVTGWPQAAGLVRALISDPVRLREKQIEILEWWERLQTKLAQEMTSILSRTKGQKSRLSFAHNAPGRLRGFKEMLKHHNGTALWARGSLTMRRFAATAIRSKYL